MAIRPLGLDVASYQGAPDWQKVAAAGYTFAFTKITEDTNYVNPYLGHNWSGIKNAGMYRGGYHFARPSIGDARSEVDYMLATLAHYGGPLEEGDMLMLDMEAGSGDLGPWVLEFCQYTEFQTGIRPLIYTGEWFSQPHNLAAYPEIGNYGLCLAVYQATLPSPPAPWEFAAFWQYTDDGSVPGIVGPVDLQQFQGSAERIPLYGKPAGIIPIPPEPPAPEIITLAQIKAKLVDAGAAYDRGDSLRQELAAIAASIPD